MGEYRIVRDNYAGFEVQRRTWWWPFWRMAGFSNTHLSVERAEAWAANHAQAEVKYLGRFVSTPQPNVDEGDGK